jgi:hypothetical protein
MDAPVASVTFSIVLSHKSSNRPAFKGLRTTAFGLWSLAAIAAAETIGNLDLAGGPGFDSDKLAVSQQPARRWLSAPGGRLCLNPSSPKDFVIDPMAADLPLDLGAYVGTKVLRLPCVLTVRLVSPGKHETPPAPVETWSPYQLSFTTKQSDGAVIDGTDFFPDAGASLIRILKVKGAPGSRLRLEGKTSTAPKLQQSGTDSIVTISTAECHQAFCFKDLSGETLAPSTPAVPPTLADGGWSIELPVTGNAAAFAVGFGFATADEGSDKAVANAAAVFSVPVASSLSAAKARMDKLLAKVPKPAVTGLGSDGISAKDHLQAYYMAWTFLLQSTIDPLPENAAYPYPQMSLGKGALWAEGHPKCPATCGWESFLGIQWLALIDPEFGWNAYQGIMSLVDADGKLGGESLPSRKAQTAWVLFQQKADRERLAAVYPAIKRYLLWREKNPRWIYGNNAAPDEKDIEFAASWSFDVNFAIRIAETLGITGDAGMWRAKQKAMTANMKSWFFRDPAELHQFFFADKAVHSTPQRNEVRPIMILSALATPGLPADMRDRLGALFDQQFHREAPNAGFNYTKYPDNQFTALGLIESHHPQTRPFIEAILRDSIRCGEFAETIEVKPGKPVMPGGVKPSLFTAVNIIEFTWFLNGARFDGGHPVSCELPGKP